MKPYIAALILFMNVSVYTDAQNLELQTVFSDSTYQLTGVAVSQSERVFTNYPRWSGPYRYALVEVGENNTVKAYPDNEWNKWDVEKGGDKEKHFLCVQAVVIDNDDNMWVIDAGYAKNAEGDDKGQKLVKINLKTNKVEKVFPMDHIAGAGSYLNDMRIDTQRQTGYITNSGEGGVLIVDLTTGQGRQVLLNKEVVKADTSYIMERNGKKLLSNAKPFHVHSDGIALSPDNSTLYFKSLTDDKLYRVATKYLNDPMLNDDELASKVEYLGRYTTTDGMAFDPKGNLYLGDLELRRIIKLTPDLKIEEIIPPNEALAWPDSYHLTQDGWLYISCSRIDEEARFHDGINQRRGDYLIYKVKID